MAENKTIKIKRFQIGLNALVQSLVLLAILGMVNYLAYNHYKRWDFSRSQKFSLSSQTKKVLKNLEDTARIIVFFAADPQMPGSEVYSDLENLIKEYQYAAEGDLSVEYVDPIRNFNRAREIASKYTIGAGAENVVIVDYAGRSKVVNAMDMAQYDMAGMQFGQPPRLQAFTGEQALTGALLEVTDEKQKTVHFLVGQGEPDIAGDESLATLKAYFERQNLAAETLNLLNVEEIPAETELIVIVGAKYDLSEREIAMLRDFWLRHGRLFVLLDPAAYTPNLAAMLIELGVKPMDNRILATAALSEGLAMVVKEPAAEFLGGSPVTRKLAGVGTRIPGPTQSLELLQRAVQPQNIKLVSLIRAAEGFWGEADHTGESFYFDPKKDQAPPLTIAASIEQGALGDTRMRVDSSRAIVVGNDSLVRSAVLTAENMDFVLGGINWLLDREELIGITPKAVQLFSLNLTESQILNIFTLCIAAIPLSAAVLGLLIWWRRRH
jgi:ABC-type uncharacterized transport system involved in gliding motility auxiliary subunit